LPEEAEVPENCQRPSQAYQDFAQVKGSGEIDIDITRYGLKALNIDQHVLMKWITKFFQ